MLFNRFFKQPKPNKFGYTPVYYDERKEELNRKIREAKREKGLLDSDESGNERIDFSGKFSKDRNLKRNQSLDKFRSQGAAKSNRMLVIIMILIGTLIYIQFVM